MPKPSTDPATPDVALSRADTLVDAVYARFSAKYRERINRDDIASVVAELELDEKRQQRKSPALRVHQLRFIGEKYLQDQPPEPLIYRPKTFAPVANVICIPDNEVGKSSILKTIKYALTGDNGDYDADVRAWITDVWLAFALDRQKFTVLLSVRDGVPRTLLVWRGVSTSHRPHHVIVDAIRTMFIRPSFSSSFFGD